MDSETSRAIGSLEGRLDGHDQEISGMRDQLASIQGTVGGIDGKLDRLLGSGPHPVVTASQSAVEPQTSSVLGNAVKLANKPIVIHTLYLGVGLLVLLWLLVTATGRPAEDFAPWFNERRSGIAPVKETGP